MMTNDEWLERATTFSFGYCVIQKRPVFIESRDQPNGERLWVLKLESSNGWVLGKDGEFHYEPLPSGRTDDFIKLTRFKSPNEAHTFWKENIKEVKPLYIE
jgi:hypothetical protein